jgi:hypothetical protein
MVAVSFNFEFTDEQIELIKELGEFEKEIKPEPPFVILRKTNRLVIESLRQFLFGNQSIPVVLYDNDHGQEDLWLTEIGKMIYEELENQNEN